MNNINPATEAFHDQTQLDEHLEAVLEDVKAQLKEEHALTQEIDVLNDKIDVLVDELFAKQDQRHQLRIHVQQELAAALYPMVESELRDSLSAKSGLGTVRDMQVINEVLNERCAELLAELTQQPHQH